VDTSSAACCVSSDAAAFPVVADVETVAVEVDNFEEGAAAAGASTPSVISAIMRSTSRSAADSTPSDYRYLGMTSRKRMANNVAHLHGGHCVSYYFIDQSRLRRQKVKEGKASKLLEILYLFHLTGHGTHGL
jgi:hypothetical protein